MPWAEFVLRSFGFKERLERERKMLGELIYMVHCNRLVYNNPFGKSKKPPTLESFLGVPKKQVKKEIPEAFMKARAEYLKNKK